MSKTENDLPEGSECAGTYNDFSSVEPCLFVFNHQVLLLGAVVSRWPGVLLVMCLSRTFKALVFVQEMTLFQEERNSCMRDVTF